VNTIPVEVAAPTYIDRSDQQSRQRTQNLYLGQGIDTKWAAYPFPGCKPLVTASGRDRGLYVFNSELYRVLNSSLVKVVANGTLTVIGFIGGVERCIFDDDGLNIFIATGGIVYRYNLVNVSVVSSTNLETPNSVSYLNGFFLYDGDEGRFQASDAGDGSTINDLSVGVANSDGDPIVRGFPHNQLVYWFGSRSIEPWYFSGSGDLPFDRLDQAFIPIGLAALHSLGADEDAMYFLGNTRQFYKLSRSQAISISDPSIATIVENFTTVDDAIGWCFTFHGQQFYWVNFPTENRSFLYSTTHNYWVDLSYEMDGERHLGNSYAYCYGKHYVTDYRNGNLYELDPNTYTDNGQPILRIRDTAPITGKALGLSGNRIAVGRLQLNMQKGVGLATGQGSTPEIMCRISNDGGKSFGAEDQISIGVMGAYDSRVDFYQFADGYSIIYRILFSDPAYFSFFGGFVDVDDAGH
jgi:hypothetical protein